MIGWFDATTTGGLSARVLKLQDSAELVHLPRFLDRTEAGDLLQATIAFPWQRKLIRGVLTKRANVWFAAHDVEYRYSGQAWKAEPMPAELAQLAERIGAECREAFDCALATHYPNGSAAVGWHADNEPIFEPNPTIASLSLGGPRTFDIVHHSRAKSGRPDVSVKLHSGDLVVMKGMQPSFLHRLRTTTLAGIRTNLSFRRLVSGMVDAHPR